MPNHYGNTRNLSQQSPQAQLKVNSARGKGKKPFIPSSPSEKELSKSKVENGKVIIDLAKKIFDNKAYESFNRDFIELSKSENNLDFKKFFDLYKDLFYVIPEEGPLSHATLFKQSKEYISNLYDPKEDDLENIVKEIEKQEQILFDLQQPKKSHPFYRDNTFLKLEGTPLFETYIIQTGVKRKITNALVYDTLKSNIGLQGVSDQFVYQLIGADVLNSIPSGPDINTEVDISIPLTEFDEIEELTTTQLLDLVETYNILTGEFVGFFEIQYILIDPETGTYGDDVFLKLEPNRNYSVKTFSPHGAQNIIDPNLNSGFKSIKNYSNVPITNNNLVVNNSDFNVEDVNILFEQIDTSYYIPINLEIQKSLNLKNSINNYERRIIIKNERDLGIFGGREVRTRVITPGASFGGTDNVDVQRIFNNPQSFYYKWEHRAINQGGVRANVLHLKDGSLYRDYDYVDSNKDFPYLSKFSRVYGNPIYRFVSGQNGILDTGEGYWVLLNGRTINKVPTQTNTSMNYSYTTNLAGTEHQHFFLKLTSNDGIDILEARNLSTKDYNFNATIQKITTYTNNNALKNKIKITTKKGESVVKSKDRFNIIEVYSGFHVSQPYNAADKEILSDIFVL